MIWPVALPSALNTHAPVPSSPPSITIESPTKWIAVAVPVTPLSPAMPNVDRCCFDSASNRWTSVPISIATRLPSVFHDSAAVDADAFLPGVQNPAAQPSTIFAPIECPGCGPAS